MSANDIRAGGAYVETYVKGDLGKQFDAIARKLKAFGDSVTNIGRSIGAIGASILAPLLGATVAFDKLGKELELASQKTGLSVEALSILKYAAEQTGATLDDVTAGIRHMQRSLIEAADGSSKSVEALRSLNLTVQDLRKLSPEDQFKLISDRLAGIQSPALRSALAMQLLGRGGTALLPMIRNLDALEAKAKALGVVMSTEDAEAAKKFSDVLDDLYQQMRAVTFQVGAAVGQALEPFAVALRSILPEVISFTKEHRGLVQAALAVGIGLTAVGGSLVIFGQSLKLVGSSWLAVSNLFKTGTALIKTAIVLPITLATSAFSALMTIGGLAASTITGAFALVGTVVGGAIAIITSPIALIAVGIGAIAVAAIYVSGVVPTVFNAIASAATSAGSKIKTTFFTAISAIQSVFSELKSTALETFGGISDALSAGDIAIAGRILWVGLKLAWLEGTQGLRNTWSSFTTEFTQVAGAAFYGAEEVWTKVKIGLQESWASLTTTIGNLWDAVVGTMLSAWGTIADAVSKTINDVHEVYSSLSGGSYTADSDNDKVDNDRAAKEGKRRQDEMTQMEAQNKRNAADQASLEAEKTAQLKAISDKEAALSKGATDSNAKERSDLEKQKADLQKQLDDLRSKAGKEKQTSDSKAKDDAKKEQDANNNPDKLPSETGTGKAIGTFNINGLQALVGAQSAADRTAKATEEIAKNTKPKSGGIPNQKNEPQTPGKHVPIWANWGADSKQSSGYMTPALTDSKRNDDGTYSVKTAYGITATFTKEMMDLIKQKQASMPKQTDSIEKAAQQAARRHEQMVNKTPKTTKDKDVHTEMIAKNTTDANTYLKQIVAGMPAFT